FALVRVGAESVQGGDLGADRDRLAEDVDGLRAIAQPPAERALGLEADEQDRVPDVAEAVAQMVQDAPALAHARGGDEDARGGEVVERPRLLGAPDVAQPLESERLALPLLERAPGRLIEP